MSTRRDEQIRAERFSAKVDLLLQDSGAEHGHLDPADAGLLNTARRFAKLPDLLGPMDPTFEQQILRQTRVQVAASQRGPRRRLLYTMAGVAAVLLLVIVLTPAGQTAVAGLRAVFSLGSTEVQIEPGLTPHLPALAGSGGAAVRQSLTLAQAQQQVSFAIAQPRELAEGYQLQKVYSYTYPELPAWVPQPIFVELVYADDHESEMLLRVYSISLGEEATISGLNLQAEPIRSVQDIDVDGRPGVLLELGAPRSALVWHEVVWEQQGLILALSSLHLTPDELLRIAASVR
jgi:hypothetical protein